MKLFFKLIVCFLLMAWDAKALSVSPKEVFAAIEEEFSEQGIGDEIELEIFGGDTSFDLEQAKKSKILVSDLKADDISGRFNCLLEVFADGKSFKKTEIVGKYYLLTDAYIPSVFLNKGDVITEDKLKKVALRVNRLKPGNVIELDKLLDKEVKKPIKEGRIIYDREIGNKIAIRKGDIVTVVYKTEKMQIQAKVEALTEAGVGEKILIKNTKSKKEFYGTVLDKNTVEAEAGL